MQINTPGMNYAFYSGPEIMLYSHSLLSHIHGEPLPIKPGDSFRYREESTNWAEEKSGELVASNKNINIISLYSSSSLEYRKHKIILFLKCCKSESHTVHAASVSFTENCV